MPDWTGRRIENVEIKDLIARGGMAEIYTGIHTNYGLVAVKVMRGLLERDKDQLARFEREADVVRKLRHRNIVHMMDYVVEDETPCLIMDYIPGPTLAQYMKHLHEHDKHIPLEVVAKLLHSIASALDYAHKQGIIHRDIKPANVLLRSPSQEIDIERALLLDVEPILTDFGLVRLLDSTLQTTSGSVSGTPTYMSPEQSRGEKVDKHTDIYSLGVMLYEMVAGSVPFQAETAFGMLMKHINEPPPPIKSISQDLQDLLDRALAKDPRVRYQTASEMANEFYTIINGKSASSDTKYFAEVARKALEIGNTGVQIKTTQPFPWKRILLEASIAIVFAVILGLGIARFLCPCASIP